jgi:hypothetical protein
MNTVNTSVSRAFLLTVLIAIQPCLAQTIEPGSEFRDPVVGSPKHVFGVRTTGMNPEVIRSNNSSILPRKSEIRPVSPTVLEQIGRLKQSMPNHLGVH